MSVRIMSLVWELDLPDSEKLVLLALGDCANDEGHCWPSIATLKTKCSKSDRTVQLAIKMLCAKGHLTQRIVPGKGANYTVHPIVRLADPRTGFAPEAPSPRSDCATAPKPVRDTPEAASDKPSKNHQEPSKTAPARRCFLKGIGLPEEIPAEPWLAFVKMRKAKDKGFTEDSARGAVRRVMKLAGEGYDPAKLLWRSVDNCWKGFFEHDDCKVTRVAGGRDSAWHEDQARFFEKIGKPDDAAEHRRKAVSLGQIANDLLRTARPA